jgi:hypothetical protein
MKRLDRQGIYSWVTLGITLRSVGGLNLLMGVRGSSLRWFFDGKMRTLEVYTNNLLWAVGPFNHGSHGKEALLAGQFETTRNHVDSFLSQGGEMAPK